MKDERIEKLIRESALTTSKGFTEAVMEKVKLETDRDRIPMRQIVLVLLGMLIFGCLLFVYGSKQLDFSLFGTAYRTPFLSVQLVLVLFFLIGIYTVLGQRHRMPED